MTIEWSSSCCEHERGKSRRWWGTGNISFRKTCPLVVFGIRKIFMHKITQNNQQHIIKLTTLMFSEAVLALTKFFYVCLQIFALSIKGTPPLLSFIPCYSQNLYLHVEIHTEILLLVRILLFIKCVLLRNCKVYKWSYIIIFSGQLVMLLHSFLYLIVFQDHCMDFAELSLRSYVNPRII